MKAKLIINNKEYSINLITPLDFGGKETPEFLLFEASENEIKPYKGELTITTSFKGGGQIWSMGKAIITSTSSLYSAENKLQKFKIIPLYE